MDVNTRNRADLKAFFVKNSIPTQSNFADLIDGMLNQKDDGFVKAKNLPLSIEAADPGVADSEKKAVTIYQSFADLNPAWTLSLNPRTAPNDPRTAKLGFAISDGEGASRLFIDRNGGNVGIGTTNPESKLTVSSPSSHLQLRRETTETTGGKQIFLELFQADTTSLDVPEVSSSIRFHHRNRFWHRIEASSDGFHFKTGDINLEDYVDVHAGKIISPKWKVTRLFNRQAGQAGQVGPLPIEASFTSSGGTLVVFTSGTVFTTIGGLMRLQFTIDGGNAKFVEYSSNEVNSHKTYPATVEVFTGIAAGMHTFRIAVWNDTAVSDFNDRFYATVLELPF